ncbi:MAG TPA: hypothetical protein VNE18_10420 [Rhodanobacter sp.]|nr:hypothetical protein [Rhodanobacter sp.]
MNAQLSTLRSELRARLGLAAAADTYGPSTTILNSFLARAQNWLYWQYGWEQLRRTWTFATVIGTQGYAWPTNGANEVCEPRKIVDVWLNNAGAVTELREGVTAALNGDTSQAIPTRYWRADQIYLWHIPDAVYTVDLVSYMKLGAFAADADPVTLDDEPVMELAIAIGKAHYRQTDSVGYLTMLSALINKLNARDDVTGNVSVQTVAAP